MKFLIILLIFVGVSGTTIPNVYAENVPDWVKNTAGWWATDVISEIEFVNAIEFLINDGIIKTESKSECESHILKYFDDKEEINNVCKEHSISKNEELTPYYIELEFNEKGFRGENFDDKKKSDTYRIFMIGGSTMANSETVNDATISSILQKMFDSSEIDTEVEVINVGISGSNTSMELNLIRSSLVTYEPDMMIMYDGWNDLSTDLPIDIITKNYQSICVLAIENNFKLIMTLQPLPGFGNKILTEQEKINSLTAEDHNGYQILQAKSTYNYLDREIRKLADSAVKYDNCEMYDLRNVFDNVSGPIYFDGGHTLQTGNLILAEKFFEISMNEINPSFQVEKSFSDIVSKHNSESVIKYLFSKLGISNHGFDEKLVDPLETDILKGKYFHLKHAHGDTSKIFVGKDLRNADLQNMDLDGYDLSGANLSGQDLRGIDFSNVIIHGADLTYSNLEGVSFQDVNVIGVDFSNANMKNTDLRDAEIGKTIQIRKSPDCGNMMSNKLNDVISRFNCSITVASNEDIRTKFINTDLENAKFGNIDGTFMISYVDFSNSNLSNAQFNNINCLACKFNNAILNNMNAEELGLVFSDLENIEMKNANFDLQLVQQSSFEDASIIDSIFNSFAVINSNFKNTDLEDSIVSIRFIDEETDLSCKNNSICKP